VEELIINSIEVANPYPGLRSFEPEEDFLFYGREQQIDDLIRKLRNNKFLAVLGTSGSGKSSLVKSGVIPALYSGFMSGTGSLWNVINFRSGSNPTQNLAKALFENTRGHLEPLGLNSNDGLNSIEATLKNSAQGLEQFYQKFAVPGENLLLLIDQFEELFRFTSSDNTTHFKEAKRLLDNLLWATKSTNLPIYVVITMRSDFLGDCTHFEGLPEAINEGNYLVPKMTSDQLKSAIVGPAAVGGAMVSNELLNRLMQDIGENQDQLPILQHVLMRVWECWNDKYKREGKLDIIHYEEVGTVTQALSLHAEEAFLELKTDRLQDVCRGLFRTLTDRGNDGRGVRRPTPVSKVMELVGASFEEVSQVAHTFRKVGRAFLVPSAKSTLSESSILDISHESLMRVWQRLIRWVEEESESIDMYVRLCEAADQYENRKGSLWRDPELTLALKWRADNVPNSAWASRINGNFERAMLFLEYSEEQQKREIEFAENQQKQKLLRARRFSITISIIGVIALGFGVWAFFERIKAEENRKKAELKEIEAKEQTEIAKGEKAKADLLVKEISSAQSDLEKQFKEIKALQLQAEANLVKANNATKAAKIAAELAKSNESKATAAAEYAENQRKFAEKQTAIVEENTKKSVIAQTALSSVIKLEEKEFEKSKQEVLTALEDARKLKFTDFYNHILLPMYFNWAWNNQERNILRTGSPVRQILYNKKSDQIISLTENGTIRISKISADHNRLSLSNSVNTINGIQSIAINESTGKLYLGLKNGNIAIANISSNSLIVEKQIPAKIPFNNFTKVNVVAGNIIIQQGTTAYLWNETMQVPTRIDGVSAFTVSNKGSIAWIRNGNLEYFSDGKNLLGKPNKSAKIDLQYVTAMTFSSSGDTIAIGSKRGRMGYYYCNQNTFSVFKSLHLSELTSLNWVYDLNGKAVILSTGFDNYLRIIGIDEFLTADYANKVVKMKIHDSWIYDSRWIPSHHGLVSISEDFSIRFHLLDLVYLEAELKK